MKKKRDIQILISLLGILAAFLSYQFVYTKYMDKTTALESEITVLESRISELSALQAKATTYTEETDKMNQEMEQYFLEFPADVKPEDGIMFAVNLAKNTDNMTVSSVSLGAHEQVIQLGATGGTTDTAATTTGSTTDTGTTTDTSTATDADTSAGTTTDATGTTSTDSGATAVAGPILYKVPVGLTYQVTYTGLKDMIQYVYNEQDRMTIDSLAVSFDATTGILTGTANLNMYLMTGTDNVYNEPNIPDILLGTDNIFGTIELPPQTIVQ